MNLPALTNQDNVGNYYWGWRTNNNAFSTSQIQLNAQTLVAWINSIFPDSAISSNNTNNFNLILPHASEVLTTPVTVDKYRFNQSILSTINSNNNVGSNTIPYQTPGGGVSFNLNSTNRVYYCVLNSSSLSLFRCVFTGNSLNPGAGYIFVSVGFVKNPLYSGSQFPRNCYYYALFNDGTNRGAGSPNLENTNVRTALRVPTTASADSIANYSITCQNSTPDANTTDLVLRWDGSPHKAIGIANNLLKTTLSIPVGQIYRNTGVDPDGSNNDTWICVGEMGNERILMRVWAEGLN